MQKKRMFTLIWGFGGVGVAVTLGWLALRGVHWSELSTSLDKLSWNMLLPAVSAVLLSIFFQAIRWKLLLPGESISTIRLFCVRNAGISLNNLLPARGIVGEASELAMLTRSDNIAGGKVAASIFMSRALDFVVTSLFGLAGFIVIPQLSVFKNAIIPMLVVASTIMVCALLATRISRINFVSKIKPLSAALQATGRLPARRAFWLSLALTAGSWMLLGTASWLMAQALGIQLPFWMMSIIFVGIGLFSSAIPSGPSSIGVFEFVTVYTLGLFAVDKPEALAFALLIHALIILPPSVIGIPMLYRERKVFPQLMAQVSDVVRRIAGRKCAAATPEIESV